MKSAQELLVCLCNKIPTILTLFWSMVEINTTAEPCQKFMLLFCNQTRKSHIKEMSLMIEFLFLWPKSAKSNIGTGAQKSIKWYFAIFKWSIKWVQNLIINCISYVSQFSTPNLYLVPWFLPSVIWLIKTQTEPKIFNVH